MVKMYDINQIQGDIFMGKARLTGRRIEILRLMAKGYKDEQIGRVMGLHITNVKMQKSRLYNFLGVHNKKDALHVGLEKCLVNYLDFKVPPKEKKSPFIIRLEIENKLLETYRIPEELFFEIKEKITPYRSIQAKSKMIKCIETGKIFKNAKAANRWLIQEGLTESYDAHFGIKRACQGKQNIAYGYHWEFLGLLI